MASVAMVSILLPQYTCPHNVVVMEVKNKLSGPGGASPPIHNQILEVLVLNFSGCVFLLIFMFFLFFETQVIIELKYLDTISHSFSESA